MSLHSFAIDGLDFEAMGELISIDAGSVNGSESCFNFYIIDDSFVEKNENFTLHVKLEDRNVWIKGSSYLPITIYDDDCELTATVESFFYSELPLIWTLEKCGHLCIPDT